MGGGDRFGLFGNGFDPPRPVVPVTQAYEVYWRSKIGLNVSLSNDLECYTSDRLHRILGCGALLLTKSFPMMSTYGLNHGENCLVWETPEEAVQLAREVLADDTTREEIARAGAQLARENHTWDVRMLELAPLLDAARGESHAAHLSAEDLAEVRREAALDAANSSGNTPEPSEVL